MSWDNNRLHYWRLKRRIVVNFIKKALKALFTSYKNRWEIPVS